MKIPGRCGKRKWGTVGAIFVMAVAVVVVGLIPAWAAGGGQAEQSGHAADAGHAAEGDHAAEGGHGEVHSPPWLITDTAKVLNFAVLAILLFLVLRKPASQALNGRIKGIADELEDLERADHRFCVPCLGPVGPCVSACPARQASAGRIHIAHRPKNPAGPRLRALPDGP